MKRVAKHAASAKKVLRARLRLILVSIAILNLFVSGFVAYRIYEQSTLVSNNSFQNRAQLATNAMAERLTDYQDLLYSGQALLNQGQVTQDQWDTFYRNQSIYRRYKGINSVAYIASVTPDSYDDFVAKMRTNSYAGSIYTPPERADKIMGLLNVYSSNDNIAIAFKKDFYADTTRMPVYQASGKLRRPVASPPLTLATGYEGFFISMPVNGTGAYSGYVVAAFRHDELMRALLPNDPNTKLAYSVKDVSPDGDKLIYQSDQYSEKTENIRQFLDVGGRTWAIKLMDVSESKFNTGAKLAAIIALSGIVLSLIVLLTSRRI